MVVSTMAFVHDFSGGGEQGLADGNAFGVIGVEQGGVGVAAYDHGQLPCQVVGVLDACVQSLPGGKRVVSAATSRRGFFATSNGSSRTDWSPGHWHSCATT